MIWFVGNDLDQYRPIIHLLSGEKIPSRHYRSLSEIFSKIDESPRAIVVDMDGVEALSLEFCWMTTHSYHPQNTSVVLVSSNQNESLEVSAFQSGASDFILKPLKIRPAFMRISTRVFGHNEKNILRSVEKGQTILEINKEEFSVRFREEEITLSRKEFELLYLFASNPGKVFSREEIHRRLWSGTFDPKERTIDVHILRIRKKLEDAIITTLKGVGYRFSLNNLKQKGI